MKKLLATTVVAFAAVFSLFLSTPTSADGQLGPQGDITAVNAGSGLTGGSARGPATLAVDFATTQKRVVTTCGAGSAMQSIGSDGVATCIAGGGGGGSLTDGDKGDITVTSTGATWTIDNAAVTLAKMANLATATFLGRTTAGTGVPEALTGTQATAMLNVFTSALKGLVPASGGGTTTFLRADGTFATPVDTNTTYTSSSGVLLTGTNFTANLPGGTCAAGTGGNSLSAGGTLSCTADVTAITAGTGISAPTVSGTTTITANLAGASCSAGNFVSAISATGTGTCTAAPAGTVTGTGSVNRVARFTSSTAVGDSGITDTGSLVTITSPVATPLSTAGLTANSLQDYSDVTATYNVASASRQAIGKRGSVVTACVSNCTPNGMTGIGVSGVAQVSGYANNVSAGIFGSSNASPTLPTTGSWAGYFDGDVGTNSAVRGFTMYENGVRVVGNMGCSTNQIPKWNGSAWACAADGPPPSVTTTATIAATTHNWAPSGFTPGVTTTISFTAASTYAITGLVATGAVNGTRITLRNDGNVVTYLYDNDANSTAANRFNMNGWGALFRLESGNTAVFEYNTTFSAWLAVSKSGRFVSSAYVSEQLISYGPTGLNYDATNASTFYTSGVTINGGNATSPINIGGAGTGNINIGNSGNLADFASPIRIVDGTSKLMTKSAGSISLSAGCGTGATFSGDRNAAYVQMGTGASNCTVTFTNPFTNNPTCVTDTDGATKTYTKGATTGQIVFTTVASSTRYSYICVDHF